MPSGPASSRSHSVIFVHCALSAILCLAVSDEAELNHPLTRGEAGVADDDAEVLPRRRLMRTEDLATLAGGEREALLADLNAQASHRVGGLHEGALQYAGISPHEVRPSQMPESNLLKQPSVVAATAAEPAEDQEDTGADAMPLGVDQGRMPAAALGTQPQLDFTGVVFANGTAANATSATADSNSTAALSTPTQSSNASAASNAPPQAPSNGTAVVLKDPVPAMTPLGNLSSHGADTPAVNASTINSEAGWHNTNSSAEAPMSGDSPIANAVANAVAGAAAAATNSTATGLSNGFQIKGKFSTQIGHGTSPAAAPTKSTASRGPSPAPPFVNQTVTRTSVSHTTVTNHTVVDTVVTTVTNNQTNVSQTTDINGNPKEYPWFDRMKGWRGSRDAKAKAAPAPPPVVPPAAWPWPPPYPYPYPPYPGPPPPGANVSQPPAPPQGANVSSGQAAGWQNPPAAAAATTSVAWAAATTAAPAVNANWSAAGGVPAAAAAAAAAAPTTTPSPWQVATNPEGGAAPLPAKAPTVNATPAVQPAVPTTAAPAWQSASTSAPAETQAPAANDTAPAPPSPVWESVTPAPAPGISNQQPAPSPPPLDFKPEVAHAETHSGLPVVSDTAQTLGGADSEEDSSSEPAWDLPHSEQMPHPQVTEESVEEAEGGSPFRSYGCPSCVLLFGTMAWFAAA